MNELQVHVARESVVHGTGLARYTGAPDEDEIEEQAEDVRSDDEPTLFCWKAGPAAPNFARAVDRKRVFATIGERSEDPSSLSIELKGSQTEPALVIMEQKAAKARTRVQFDLEVVSLGKSHASSEIVSGGDTTSKENVKGGDWASTVLPNPPVSEIRTKLHQRAQSLRPPGAQGPPLAVPSLLHLPKAGARSDIDHQSEQEVVPALLDQAARDQGTAGKPKRSNYSASSHSEAPSFGDLPLRHPSRGDSSNESNEIQRKTTNFDKDKSCSSEGCSSQGSRSLASNYAEVQGPGRCHGVQRRSPTVGAKVLDKDISSRGQSLVDRAVRMETFSSKLFERQKQKQAKLEAVLSLRETEFKKTYKENDFTWCQNLLLLETDSARGLGGVPASKYNYCDARHRAVRLYLTADFRTLCWKSDGGFFASKVSVASITGVLFGAYSSTFSQHQSFVLNYDRFKNFAFSGAQLGNLRPRRHRALTSPTGREGIRRPGLSAEEQESPQNTFYCWECVSLLTSTRTIDFVIKNRTHMFAFLNVLLNLLRKEQLLQANRYKPKPVAPPASQSRLACFCKPKASHLMPRSLLQPTFRYKLLMMKMKISYMAWEKNVDVLQLFCDAIR